MQSFVFLRRDNWYFSIEKTKDTVDISYEIFITDDKTYLKKGNETSEFKK